MKRFTWAVLLAAMATGSLQANGTYYYGDAFSTINTTLWHQNGVASAAAGVGLTSADASGGSLIALVAPPAGHISGEIDSTLAVGAIGGTIVHYHLASSDARSGPAAAGSYLSAELRNISMTSGVCSATLVIEQRVSNVVTDLAALPVGCRANSVFRTVLRAGSNALYVFIDDYWVTALPAPALSGSPGVGVRNCGAGTGIALTWLGALDITAPGAIPAGTLRWTPFPSQIEFQWAGAADDASGVGMSGYEIYRRTNPSDPNSQWVYFARTPSPDLIDQAVQPGTTYAYVIYPYDADCNMGPASSVVITTPAAPTTVARRVGIRPTGAYWGGSPEQIDLFSGNLNITLPLLTAIGRGGLTAAIGLSYNSQLWRQDANGIWNLGGDVGFGYGWKLLIGSLTPVYSGSWTLHHYVYTDSTGAQYRLDTKANGLWRSSEGVYAQCDPNTNRLMLPDGRFFEMNAVSEGAEWDAGTRYPTRLIDPSGNYIQFTYMQGRNAQDDNSSSRLLTVQDPRTRGVDNTCPATALYCSTYILHYTSSSTPHLSSIVNAIGTGEDYTFQYADVSSLTSPFSPTRSFDPTTLLSSVANSIGHTNTFAYTPSNTGEMVQLTLPYGGIMQWGYSAVTNSAGMTQNEVSTRSLTTTLGGTASTVAFTLASNDSSSMLHPQRTVVDSASAAARRYSFQSDATSPYAGLLTSEQDSNSALTQNYRSITTNWAQDPWGHPYVIETDSIQDPGSSAAVTTRRTHLMAADQTGPYGQIVKSSVYAYGDLVNPARTYQFDWIKLTGLIPLWRQRSASLAAGTNTPGVVINLFDDGGYAYYPAAPSGVTFHDSTLFAGLPNGETGTPRGLVRTQASTIGDLRNATSSYDTTGTLLAVGRSDGSSTSLGYADPSSGSPYLVPATMSPNGNSGLSSSFTWSSFLGLTQEVGPNGATTSISYDGAARPAQTTSPDGAVTTYTHNNATANAAATVVASVNGRWTITTLDGLGRTIQTDMGTGTASTANSVSRVLTVYGPCACTPMGKVMRVSRPFNPSTETLVYTIYVYDRLGRTTSVTLPDGASTTTYAYSGNMVTVTDPAGHWKKYTSDAFGNVTQVNEPNPAGGPDYITSYTYNQFDKLTTVSMPRTMPGGNVVTQTRTFTYDSAQRLVSVTHPESGTTTYTYDAAGRVLTKIYANGNKVAYTYDLYGRVTQITRTPPQYGYGTVEPEPVTTFTYDTTDSLTGLPGPMPTFEPLNTWGRLAKITHGALSVERFQYTAAGRISAKSLAILSGGVE